MFLVFYRHIAWDVNMQYPLPGRMRTSGIRSVSMQEDDFKQLVGWLPITFRYFLNLGVFTHQ